MSTDNHLTDLSRSVVRGELGPNPRHLRATTAFWIHHTTRLPDSDTAYRNYYVLIRLGGSFGACSIAEGDITDKECAWAAGRTMTEILLSGPQCLQVAAIDAYLSEVNPHRHDSRAKLVTLPAGTALKRAQRRDRAVAELLSASPGDKVALIGVVNPLVEAIESRGAHCLPCDLSLPALASGKPIESDMWKVLPKADSVVATGMTIGNGTFDSLLTHCRSNGVPLVCYAQTGSAIARHFLGDGVTALCAEPFPFSQFSAEPTNLYLYRNDRDR